MVNILTKCTHNKWVSSNIMLRLVYGLLFKMTNYFKKLSNLHIYTIYHSFLLEICNYFSNLLHGLASFWVIYGWNSRRPLFGALCDYSNTLYIRVCCKIWNKMVIFLSLFLLIFCRSVLWKSVYLKDEWNKGRWW